MVATAGILGKEFASKKEAVAFLESQKATKEGRVAMRVDGGWASGTVRAFEVHKLELL